MDILLFLAVANISMLIGFFFGAAMTKAKEIDEEMEAEVPTASYTPL